MIDHRRLDLSAYVHQFQGLILAYVRHQSEVDDSFERILEHNVQQY